MWLGHYPHLQLPALVFQAEQIIQMPVLTVRRFGEKFNFMGLKGQRVSSGWT
jgi:hypothetical protein